MWSVVPVTVTGTRATEPDELLLEEAELLDEPDDDVLDEADDDELVVDEEDPPVPAGLELEHAEAATRATGETSVAAQKVRRSESDLSIIRSTLLFLLLKVNSKKRAGVRIRPSF